MPKYFNHNALLIAAALGLALASLAGQATAATPNPPSTICIDSTSCGSSAGAAFKWYPGTYVFPGSVKCDSGTQGNDFATIDEIASVPQVKGVYIRWEWSCFEGNTAGDYSAGFARIDAYIAKLAPLGKKLMLSVWPMYWGDCSSAEVSQGHPNFVPLPAYIQAQSRWVYYCQNSRTYTIAFDQPGVVDRLIALSAALAARYDTNPTVVMWEPHEETAGLQGTASLGWTWDAAQTQWRRLFAAMATQWRHTIVRDAINWLKDNQSCNADVLASGRAGIAFGGADAMPESLMQIMCNYVYRGLDYPSGNINSSFADYRETYPWISEHQGGVIYRNDAATLQQFQDYDHDTMHARFIIWVKQTWDGGTNRYWNNVLPFIQGGHTPVYSTACPRGWTCNSQ